SSGRDCKQDAKLALFIKEFMCSSTEDYKAGKGTPFEILVSKLQESLARIETFEVELAHHALDGNQNAASSFSSQLRLKLSPENGTVISSGYNNLLISTHSLVTFRVLEEYLKPKIKKIIS